MLVNTSVYTQNASERNQIGQTTFGRDRAHIVIRSQLGVNTIHTA